MASRWTPVLRDMRKPGMTIIAAMNRGKRRVLSRKARVRTRSTNSRRMTAQILCMNRLLRRRSRRFDADLGDENGLERGFHHFEPGQSDLFLHQGMEQPVGVPG